MKKNKTQQIKRPVGHPAIWTDPKVLEKLIDQYFENQQKPTLSGLAYALDIDRQTLYNYASRDEFFDTIRRARRKIELIYEEHLLYSDKPTGVIFALKNTGWKDNQAIDHTTLGKELPHPIYGGESTKKV